MNNIIRIDNENPQISTESKNNSSKNLNIYYRLQAEGDPNFKLKEVSARKGGVKAEYTAAGWVYQNKKDAEEKAKEWTKGKRKIHVTPYYEPRLDDIWNGSKNKARLSKQSIKLEIESNRISKKRQEIISQCQSKGLHQSWLYEKLLPDDMPEQDKKTHAYFKPFWDKSLEEKDEIDLRTADLSREEEDIEDVEAQNRQPTTCEPTFKPHSFFDLIHMPPKMWLMNQVFGHNDIGMIYGSPGCGKSFIAIDMILTLCTGGLWANRFIVNRELNVAYCAGEGISGLPARFATAAKFHNISSLHNFTFYKTIPQLYEDSSTVTVTIKQFIQEWKARQQEKEANPLDVLIIETLHTASVGADENTAKDAGKVIQACRLAANDLGCTVILVHHTDKNGLRERGSSAYRAAMDFMIGINKQESGKNATMYCEKLKDGEEWQDQDFQLSPLEGCSSVHVLWKEVKNESSLSNSKVSDSKMTDKKFILNEMDRYPGNAFTSKQLSEVIGKTQPYTIKLLTELVEKEKCMRKIRDPDKDQSSRNPWVYFIEKKK